MALPGCGLLQDSPADPAFGMAKTGWVLYFRGTEGYFDQARYEMRDVSSYLTGYERLMARGMCCTWARILPD